MKSLELTLSSGTTCVIKFLMHSSLFGSLREQGVICKLPAEKRK